jgi:hypothetical protein
MKSDFFCTTSLFFYRRIEDSGSLSYLFVLRVDVFLEDLRLLMLCMFDVAFGRSISRRLGGTKPELLFPISF